MSKRVPTTSLHVSDILNAPASCREIPVRSVGPAVVIVLEVDSPPRILSHAYSDAEFRSLTSWLSSDEQANHVICAYSDTRATEEGIEDFARCERERKHEERLGVGIRS